MKAKFLNLALVLLISVSTYAQEAMFKVLASKGANKVVTTGSTEEKQVLIGQKLLSTDKIVIAENSYLGLAHKNGKTIELKKAGTYEVAQLSSEVAAQNGSVTSKYVKFVAGEISAQDENLAQNRHKYMAVTGSVERSTPSIKMICPKDPECLEDVVLIKWYPVEKATKYKVTLTDISDESLFSTEITDNFVLVDLSKLKLKEQQNILVKIESIVKGKKTSEGSNCIKYVKAENATSLEKELAEMKASYVDETALNKYVLATFFEEKGLVLEAITNYEAAIKLEPGVEEYQAAYGQLLENNKITEVKK